MVQVYNEKDKSVPKRTDYFYFCKTNTGLYYGGNKYV